MGAICALSYHTMDYVLHLSLPNEGVEDVEKVAERADREEEL